MALKDFLPKKPTKKDEENKEKVSVFVRELDVLQRKHDMAIAAYIEYTDTGISPKFRIIPYPKEDAKA